MQVERWLTRRVLGWALFDIASRPTSRWCRRSSACTSRQWWPAAGRRRMRGGAPPLPPACCLREILAPIVGAHADRTGRWLLAVAVTNPLCRTAAVLLPGPPRWASLAAPAAVFVLAQVGYHRWHQHLRLAGRRRRGPRPPGPDLGPGLGSACSAASSHRWRAGDDRRTAGRAQVPAPDSLFVLRRRVVRRARRAGLPGCAACGGRPSCRPATPRPGGERAAPSARPCAAGAGTCRRCRCWSSFFLINDVLVTISSHRHRDVVAVRRGGRRAAWLALLYTCRHPVDVGLRHPGRPLGPRNQPS